MTDQKILRVIVTDDEPLAMALIADYVRKTPALQLVLDTTKPLEALQYVQEGKADLIFLDIQMPELTGIQFMKIIRNACQVIVTTAYADYAVEGYEHDVVDYLLKPVTFERFLIATKKAITRVNGRKEEMFTVPPSCIFVKSEYRVQKINLADILFIEGLRDYIAIHTLSSKVLTLESMKNIELLLPANEFIRIHKSYIISRNKIDFIEKGKVVISKRYLPVGETISFGGTGAYPLNTLV
jgi:DNA-binding LytR/AlgR family response regulator